MEQNFTCDILKDLSSLSQSANDIIEKAAKPSNEYSLWCNAFVEFAKKVYEDETPQEKEIENIKQFTNQIPKLVDFFNDEVDHIKNVNLKNSRLSAKNRVHIAKCNKKEDLSSEKASVNSTFPQNTLRKSPRLNTQNSLQENLMQSSLQNSKNSQNILANNFQNADKNTTSVLVCDTPPTILPRKNSSLNNKNNIVNHDIENQLELHDKKPSDDKRISDENIIDKEIKETPDSVASITREVRSCKRKSSLISKNTNKKQKTYSQTSTSNENLVSMNDALVKNYVSSNNKMKNSAISSHTPNVPRSSSHWKKSIIQDIEKVDKKANKLNEKQVKANENLKKICHLRQQKLEESKRKREEKMEKVLKARKEIEKAAETRLKHSIQNKIENATKDKTQKTKGKRKKPQTDESEDEKGLKENNTISTYQKIKNKIMKMPLKADSKPHDSKESSKSSGKTKFKRQDSGKENNSNPNTLEEKKQMQASNKIVKSEAESNKVNLNSTYVASTKPTPSESYDMTPQRESYTNYDISEIKSDDEEEVTVSKPFPKWATGILLKNAMIATYYNQDQVDALFSEDIPPIDLEKIFGVKKKRYLHRTSSAVWRKSEVFRTPCK